MGDLLVGGSQREHPDLVGQLGNFRISEHRDVADNFVHDVWLRSIFGGTRVSKVLRAAKDPKCKTV